MQMIDVHLPTTDGREIILTRYTQPEPEQRCCWRAAAELPEPAAAQNHRRASQTRHGSTRVRVVETYRSGTSRINDLAVVSACRWRSA